MQLEVTSDAIDLDKKGPDHLDELPQHVTDNPSLKKPPPPAYVLSLSPEERKKAEKALVRKIDMRLMPPIVIMYITNYLDRNNIASARLGGLEADLGLVGTQYQTAVSILFVGYVLMQVPSNLFLNKIGKPSLYLPTCMIVWGIVSTCTAAVQNSKSLIAIRFVLGFVEATFAPGVIFTLSSWYTREELGFRAAVYYSGALISGAFAGLIAAGIVGGMDGAAGLRAWRWLFIIEGALTIVLALLAYFVLPNFPRTTKWLTEEEKELAVWRLIEDIGEDDWIDSRDQSLWYGLKLAVMDLKVWAFTLLQFCLSGSGSITNFFPTVVQTLGYNNVNTLLLTVPPYALTVMTTYLNAIHSGRTKERFWHVILPLIVGLAAFILGATTIATAPRYVAMMLMLPGVYSAYVVVVGWTANTIPRPPGKRAVSIAIVNALSNVSSIYSSFMFPSKDSPRFILAMSVCSGTVLISILTTIVMRFWLVRLNKKFDRQEGTDGTTPKEGKGFRYTY